MGPKVINEVQEAVNDLEWWSKCLKLEFPGLPIPSNEDLLFKTNELALVLDVPGILQLMLRQSTASPENQIKYPQELFATIARHIDTYDSQTCETK